MPEFLYKALFVATGLALIAVLADILRSPAPRGVRLCAHTLMGLAGFFVLNTLAELVGLHMGVNPVTCFVSAALGLPGTALLWGLKLLL